MAEAPRSRSSWALAAVVASLVVQTLQVSLALAIVAGAVSVVYALRPQATAGR